MSPDVHYDNFLLLVERVPTFEGGDIKIVFKRNPETQSYGIYTLFPRPFEDD